MSRVPGAWLRDVVQRTFEAVGVPPEDAAAVAAGLVEADERGIASHGVQLVPMYVERIRAGSVTAVAAPSVVHEHGAVVQLDAGHALGIVTGDRAMGVAIERAREHGVGVVTVRHAFHFGGAFRFVQAAARAGCVGVAAANTRPLMPAPGGARAVVGNNPLAIGAPAPDGEPIVLDMALSEAALGKIRLAEAEGHAIPPTWATDADGVATTDPAAALRGLLLPAGGPKGFGLALLLDVLAGVLSGGAFGAAVNGLYADTGKPNDCAHFFLALDLAAFGEPAALIDRIGRLAAEVRASPTIPGVERVRLPGEPEVTRRADAQAHGVSVSEHVLAALRETARSAGVAFADPLQREPVS
jgi:LDH2 family malate/lactate/ureidoglycolate dehydrogenase